MDSDSNHSCKVFEAKMAFLAAKRLFLSRIYEALTKVGCIVCGKVQPKGCEDEPLALVFKSERNYGKHAIDANLRIILCNDCCEQKSDNMIVSSDEPYSFAEMLKEMNNDSLR